MKASVLILAISVFVASESNGQTLVNDWYGKRGEKLFIFKDSSYANFKAAGLPSNRYDVQLKGDSLFFLGKVDWKSTPIRSSASDYENDRQRIEKLVEWFEFKITKVSADTLILDCVSDKQCISNDFRSFTFFSHQRIQEIKNPVFIDLQFDRGGFHVCIDSSGQVEYWFDEANTLQMSSGEKFSGKLSHSKMQQLRYWFKSEALQELPEYIGSAADGSIKRLTIKSVPKNIFAYGTGNFPDDIQFGLIKFLNNIDKEINHKD